MIRAEIKVVICDKKPYFEPFREDPIAKEAAVLIRNEQWMREARLQRAKDQQQKYSKEKMFVCGWNSRMCMGYE